MNYLKFDLKLAFFLTTAFILMTVVGTVSHELGHYSVAKMLGYEAQINYRSAGYWDPEIYAFMKDVYTQYPREIEDGIDFPEKEKSNSDASLCHSIFCYVCRSYLFPLFGQFRVIFRKLQIGLYEFIEA